MTCQILREDQLFAFATAAGFKGGARDTIVAIAEAESGGNTCASNSSDPSGGSWGVLQINGAHFISGTTTKKCALDPLCSFKFAFGLSNGGTDFSQWGSFTNGSYTKFLNPGGPKMTAPNAAGTQPSANFLDSFGGMIMSHSTLLIVGLVVITLGFVLLVKRNQPKIERS